MGKGLYFIVNHVLIIKLNRTRVLVLFSRPAVCESRCGFNTFEIQSALVRKRFRLSGASSVNLPTRGTLPQRETAQENRSR